MLPLAGMGMQYEPIRLCGACYGENPCDRKTYGQKLQEAAEKLGVSLQTVQRLVKTGNKII
jgi:hypothetical protein